MLKNEIKEATADTSSGLWIEERQLCRNMSPFIAEQCIELEIVTFWAGLMLPSKCVLTNGAGAGHGNRMRNLRDVLVSLFPLAASPISEVQPWSVWSLQGG